MFLTDIILCTYCKYNSQLVILICDNILVVIYIVERTIMLYKDGTEK